MAKQKSMTTTYNTSTSKSQPATPKQVQKAMNAVKSTTKQPLNPYRVGKRK